MKCKMLLIAVVALGVVPATASPEDISGEWVPEITNKNRDLIRAVYEFRVDGTKLTGSVLGYREDEWPILNGKVKDDRVSFTVKEGSLTYGYDGKITGNTIKLKVVLFGVRNRQLEFTVRKAGQGSP